MKFGETLHQRSIPKWSAYNINYNELKKLIKLRTSEGVAIPTPIPGQSTNRWAYLEDELFVILKHQYDNIGLFLRSKYGEIDRRLTYLEKQVQLASKTVHQRQGSRNVQARRYQKMVQEVDEISEDIQAVSRFAAVQKTGFRKILKKYRKWTGSTALQSRLETELFSDLQLDLDMTNPMQRVSKQASTLTEELHDPMLHGLESKIAGKAVASPPDAGHSSVYQISEAEQDSALYFDAVISSAAFGKSAGTATYWIHPDNLEEARVLLLRYVRQLPTASSLQRGNSTISVQSQSSGTSTPTSAAPATHVAYFDNVLRFLKDSTANKPSKAALVTRWSQTSEAIITTSNLGHDEPSSKILRVKRKDLQIALNRDAVQKEKESLNAMNIRFLQDYLRQHRDIKPLAQVQYCRSRFVGATNSSEVGTWATLDTNLKFGPLNESFLGSTDQEPDVGEPFPHAVLEFRWEFGRKPEVVHIFDTSHLAERVHDFTTETAAIIYQQQDLPRPAWTETLQKDIRKVPVSRSSRTKRQTSATGTMSGPSSDGQPESVFSETLGRSGQPSDTSPPESLHGTLTDNTMQPTKPTPSKKKKARINAKSPARPEVRYYSEYDDPDSELYQQESYAIYVDPNEGFPGAETISKLFTWLHDSCSKAKGRVLSWISLHDRPSSKQSIAANERTALLSGRPSTGYVEDHEGDSSDSDSSPTATVDGREGIRSINKIKSKRAKAREQTSLRLSRRQRALDRSLVQFYTGLIILGYVLLVMSGILLATGRKKAFVEVDVGAIIGVVAAQVCVLLSGILIYMRKQKLSILHWGIVLVALSGLVIIGVGILVTTVARLA